MTPLGILAAKLERISRRVDTLDGADEELRLELQEAWGLAAGLEPYVSDRTTPESPALRALAQRTRAEDWASHSASGAGPVLEQEMLSGHVEGQALKFLVSLTRSRRVLEVGMFTGYSALAMAEALPEDGEVIACEIDPEVARFARRCFDESPSGHKVRIRVGPAQATLEQLAVVGEPFHLIFVDADKAGYLRYVDLVLERGLLAPDGVICVDNTLMQGQPYDAGQPTANGIAIARFNREIADDPRVEQVLLPLRDGLTLIRRAPDDESARVRR